MGLFGIVALDAGTVRLLDILTSVMGLLVAIWFIVRWSPGVSRE